MYLTKKLRALATGFAAALMFTVMTISVSANPSGSEDLPSRMNMTPTIPLTVRNQPSTDGTVLGYIYPGEVVTAAANNEGWFLITFQDQGNYVYGDYLSYVSEEDGSYNEKHASLYPGVDPSGRVYQPGSIPLQTTESTETAEPVEQPAPELSVDPLDIMMKATYDVNIRTQPGGDILNVLKQGEDIHVIGNLQDRTWYQCEYKDQTVYVSDDYLLPDFPQTMKATIAVNVRSTPDTNNAPVGLLNFNDKIKVSAEENGWFKFTYEKTGKIAYAYSDYFSVVQ